MRLFVYQFLVGAGRVGKTQLALKYAKYHLAEYPGGVVMFDAKTRHLLEYSACESNSVSWYSILAWLLKWPQLLCF
jgi:hypothetical protein